LGRISRSPEETLEIAQELGRSLERGTILCLRGDLGAGKTTFAKGLISGAIGCDPYDVTSPTFVFCNCYGEEELLYHFDLYRLSNIEEFFARGFDEVLFSGETVLIEWPERIEEILPKERREIALRMVDTTSREIDGL